MFFSGAPLNPISTTPFTTSTDDVGVGSSSGRYGTTCIDFNVTAGIADVVVDVGIDVATSVAVVVAAALKCC